MRSSRLPSSNVAAAAAARRLVQLLCGPLLLWSSACYCNAAVVAFTGSAEQKTTSSDYDGYATWDWDAITHLGFWTEPNDDVRALATAHNVRLFADAGIPDKSTWTNATARAQSVGAWVTKVKQHRIDGLFFDFEGNGLSQGQKAAYATLAAEATAALKPLNATIFICVGGRPTYELRDYPYGALANNSEFLFIMGYDMHLWDDYTCVLKGTCSAAEASIRDLSLGVRDYVNLVPTEKLVLGLPWYGQRYTDIAVPINRGQIEYKDVLRALDKPGHVVKKEYDIASQSWKITCKGECDINPQDKSKSGNVVWYDDSRSLTPKYALARNYGLMGVGVWKADNLPVPDAKNYSNDPFKAEREAMWHAIASWEHNRTVVGSGVAQMVATIVQSSEKSDRFAPQAPVQFSPSRAPGATHTIAVNLNVSKQNQVFKGIGGAFTDSVATVFSQLNSANQERVVEAMWGPSGNRYSLGRLTIGSTDFSTTVYNYNNAPHDDRFDLDQSNFSLSTHDTDKIFPLVKRAQARVAETYLHADGGTTLRFVSSSWSPPAWMKRPYLTPKPHMRNSAKPGMRDDPLIYASYALYLAKYVAAYKAAGINITMMTIQNEPDSADHMFPVAYPACNFNGTAEGLFLRDHLGPRMAQDHPGLRIYVHDGQKFHDVPILERVQAIVAAVGARAAEFISGVAFHWYGNNLKNYQYLEALRDTYPQFDLLATEATLEAPMSQHLGTSPWKEAQKYAVDIIGDLNAGASGWIEWNVLLDKTGGPTCIGTTAGIDCLPLAGHCDAPILADLQAQTLEFRDSYYITGHFSRYIPPGSIHLSTGGDGADTNSTFMATAARTPSGNVVIVVLNSDAKAARKYELELDGQYAGVEIPPHSIQTLTIATAVNGGGE